MATTMTHDLGPAPRPERAPSTLPMTPARIDRLVRPDDQLRLTIEYLNLDVDPVTKSLQRVDPREPFTGVRLVFGSQHTVEDTISIGDPTPVTAFDHRTAAESRLVFELASGTPYVLGEILDLAARSLRLDPRAVPEAAREAPATSRTRRRDRRSSGADNTEPGPDVTALEVVDSLVFSPEPDGRFTAEVKPITRDGVTELWRTRLEPTSEEPAIRPKLRAIYARPGDPRGLDRPLDERRRQDVVDATTKIPAEPIEVDRLWLTSQGAFLDLTGEWVGIDLVGYLHRATAGRDVHVEVIERGYLAPFGHPATITRVSDRQFRIDERGGITAVVVQDDYLAVTGPAVTFPSPYMPDVGRATPFTEVAVADLGSGPVVKAAIPLGDGTTIKLDNAWIVTRDGEPVPVTYSASDRTGRAGITFAASAVFVMDSKAYDVQDEVNGVSTVLGNLATYYRETPAVLDLGGQTVGWADPDARGRAGSLRVTETIDLVLDRPQLDDGDIPSDVKAELEAARRPAFYPRVERATVVDEAAASLMGGGGAVPVTYARAWLDHGNEPGNPGLAYHTLVGGTSLDRQGSGQGLVRPQLKVDTFSQTLGAGTELRATSALVTDDNPDVVWDPVEALGDAAKVFGNILLTDIVRQVNVALDQLEGEKGMPRFEVAVDGDGIHYILTWEPILKSFSVAGEPIFVVTDDLDDADLPNPFGDKESTAALRLEQVVPVDGSSEPGTELGLKLENVALRLPPGLPAVAVLFKSVRFHEPIGGTASLETEIAEWMFINVLSFLEPVRQVVMTLLDLGDIEIGPDGIKADVEIPVPSLSFGVVGVAGLNVGLALDLPNENPAKIGFNLSRREDPFRITLMGFGGTGSFELEMVADDIALLRGSMAVTYELSVSLVVVSASLSASLGVELLYKDREVTLTAYVEIKGNASVLGLVNLTGKVLLALSYNIPDQLLKGTAKVSAEVDSIFGKSETTWKETVEVALGDGSDAGPALDGARALDAGSKDVIRLSFADRFSEPQWSVYCGAFA
jgi:hypothetical protein